MSKASTPPSQQPNQAPSPNTSAWSRGPPAAASNTSSNVPSAVSTPPPPPNGASVNEPAGSTPVAIGGAAGSRKGSLMVGGNGDIVPTSMSLPVLLPVLLMLTPQATLLSALSIRPTPSSRRRPRLLRPLAATSPMR